MTKNTNEKKDILEEAAREVAALKKAAFNAARDKIAESLVPSLQAAVTEDLGAGGDPPSDYDEDGEQKRAGDNQPVVGDTGDDLSDEGDGPAVVESDETNEDGFEDVEDDDEGELDLGDEDGDEELEMSGYDEQDDSDMGMDYEDDDEDDDEEEDVIEIVEDDEDDDDAEEDEEDEGMEENKNVKAEIKNIKRENLKLKKENIRLQKGLQKLSGHVKEVNLFNSRLLGATKIMNDMSLTKNERAKVINAFDDCETISEVKRVYRVLREAYRATSKTPRNRKNRRNVKSVLGESKENNNEIARLQELAGI